jgi:hypothetical protein
MVVAFPTIGFTLDQMATFVNGVEVEGLGTAGMSRNDGLGATCVKLGANRVASKAMSPIRGPNSMVRMSGETFTVSYR